MTQPCLYCEDSGRLIVRNVGVLTTTVPCPIGCSDMYFAGCSEIGAFEDWPGLDDLYADAEEQERKRNVDP